MYPFIDMHEDLSGARFHPELRKQTDAPQLIRANAKVVIVTGFALPEESLADVVARDLTFYEETCAREPLWKMLRTKDDVSAVMHDATARGMIFHIEGFPGFRGAWEQLADWYARGWRSAGLVWNENNPLGGGTNSDAGLTALGREFIEWCETRHVLIDLAHANQALFRDCMLATRRAPFISHGGLASLIPHRRNYSNDQLRAIAERGGVLGIFFARSAMAGENVSFSVSDIAEHIRAAIDVMGEDAVAIGSDLGGMTSGTPEGLPAVASIDALWRALRAKNFTGKQVEKIAAGNAARYICEQLPA